MSDGMGGGEGAGTCGGRRVGRGGRRRWEGGGAGLAHRDLLPRPRVRAVLRHRLGLLVQKVQADEAIRNSASRFIDE